MGRHHYYDAPKEPVEGMMIFRRKDKHRTAEKVKKCSDSLEDDETLWNFTFLSNEHNDPPLKPDEKALLQKLITAVTPELKKMLHEEQIRNLALLIGFTKIGHYFLERGSVNLLEYVKETCFCLESNENHLICQGCSANILWSCEHNTVVGCCPVCHGHFKSKGPRYARANVVSQVENGVPLAHPPYEPLSPRMKQIVGQLASAKCAPAVFIAACWMRPNMANWLHFNEPHYRWKQEKANHKAYECKKCSLGVRPNPSAVCDLCHGVNPDDKPGKIWDSFTEGNGERLKRWEGMKLSPEESTKWLTSIAHRH